MSSPQVSPPPSASPDRPQKLRGPRIGVVIGAVVLLALVAGGAFVLLRGSSSPVAVELAKTMGDSGAVKTKATRDITTLSTEIETFRKDTGRYPTAEEGLESLRAAPGDASKWKGPYVSGELPRDPWGNPYVYQWPGPIGNDSFSLLSYGSDGVPGGTGDAEDITEGDR